MSYLLTQIFWCLLFTAALFFALGWLVRNWFKGREATANIVTGTERSSWQTSLDIMKSRLESETSRRVEAEKTLADSQAQHATLSTLLDQHTSDDQQLKARIVELETQQGLARNSAKEREDLNTQIATLSAQAATRDQSLRTANEDLAKQKVRLAELQVVAGENGKLKTQIADAVSTGTEIIALRARLADLEPKLKEAQLHDGELTNLRIQIGELEPQVRDWETRYQKTVAQKDEELSQCRSRMADLDAKLSQQIAKPAAVAAAERDDLKKLYGIGPVLERRLNSLGVYFFREIANWTNDDIHRYEEHLKEFRNRIERDNWVESAREQHFKKYGERLEKARSANA
jgi:predicted flap endonuclease-1-like 5' DNA nuclease